MVHEDEPVVLDRLEVAFDDERLVSDAGIALVATLAGAARDRAAGAAVREVAAGSAGCR